MRFEIYRTMLRRQWRWRLRAANWRIIASGEGYRNRADCMAAIDLVRAAHDARTFEPYTERNDHA